MRVTVVGCSGSYPGPDSPASCYLIEHGDTALLLDLGNGALGPLQRFRDLDRIDAIILSHLHADHCLDLASYYVYRRFHPDGPRPRIPVHAPSGAAARMARAYDLPVDPGMTQEFDFVDLVAGTRQIGPFVVTAARMAHPVEAYGVRVEASGAAVVYSGDTGPTPALLELARGADLALIEASFLDPEPGSDLPPDLHLSARQAAEVAGAAGVGTLVLTHLVPWNDPEASRRQAAESFGGRLMLAETGLVLEI